MKENRNGTTVFLLLVLIFTFSAQGSVFFFQFDRKNSQFSSSGTEGVSPLRKNILPLTTTIPRTGIIPRGSINDILNDKDQYFPGSDINISNRFDFLQYNATHDIVIVQQVIWIFLFNASESTEYIKGEIAKNESSFPFKPTSDHYVDNATVNGTHKVGTPAFSLDLTHGYMDTVFQIPSLTELATMFIGSNDNVTIFQYYPAYNTTSSGISTLINRTDTFKLVIGAHLSSDGFLNPWRSDDTFRQGENATSTLRTHSEDVNIPGVDISVILYDKSTNLTIANNTAAGIKYYFRDPITRNPSTTTNGDGKLKLIINTTYPDTPEGEYYFNITGDFEGTGYNTTYYDGSDPNTNIDFIYGNFHVSNEMDIVTLNHISTKPSALDPPNANTTIVTYRVEALNAYNRGIYYPANIPVFAYLNDPPSNVTLEIADILEFPDNGSGWFLTNSTGYIAFDITSVFPVVYFPDIIQTITVIANLQNNNEPSYPDVDQIHRFMRNDTVDLGFNVSIDKTISIDPDFILCDIDFSATNESGTPTPHDTTIRAGDTLNITFKVQEEDSGFGLGDVPVNISLGGSYNGVSLAIYGHAQPRQYYYNTNSSGYITVTLTTTFGETPNNTNIWLNAIADFENDSLDAWHIGKTVVTPPGYSNSSYSTASQLITVDPQYFYGHVIIPGDSPNATKIQQGETIEIEFNLKLTFNIITGPDIFPDIDGVVISILVNGTAPASFDMLVIQSLSQNSVNSSVTFTIKTNDGGITPEGVYNITATADFGAAQGLVYNITHNSVPTGKLAGKWINGFSIDNFSNVTQVFKVKNEDIIRIRIPDGEVIDPSHNDVGLISGFYNVYRVTTEINITGSYKDSAGQAFNLTDIDIYLNYSVGVPIFYIDTVTTDDKGQGRFSEIIRIPSVIPITDLEILGSDPNNTEETYDGIDNVRVVTTVNIIDFSLPSISGNATFVGESISGNGTVYDDQGVIITSTELNVRLSGWDGTQDIGIEDNDNPDINGQYVLTYTVPVGYTDDFLDIRLNVTASNHYRPNFNVYIINVYRDFLIDTLQIYFNSIDSSIDIVNNSVLIKGIENRSIAIRGTLEDLDGHVLNGKTIRTTWNATPTNQSVDGAGFFSINYSFSGYTNNTWIWQLHHRLDNGTILGTHYEITLLWEVYDTTAPSIQIISPEKFVNISEIFLNRSITQINVIVIDPDDVMDKVSVGLDTSSVTFLINGSSYNMTIVTGNTFSYDWSTLTALDSIKYNITITANDLAGNQGVTEMIMVTIDAVEPSGTINVDLYDNEYVKVGSDGKVEISGTITDSGSGLNNSSVQLIFLSGEYNVTENITVTSGIYSHDWIIILNPNDFDRLSRTSPYDELERWKIVLTFNDNAGNNNITELIVKLDNEPPTLSIVKKLEKEELVVNVTIRDDESGLNMDTLTFQLVLNSTMEVVDDYTFRYRDRPPNITLTETGASLVLDISELEKGDYFIRVTIYDNTANQRQINSPLFKIGRPGAPSILENLLIFIVSPILAFGGGIGLAALYERFKGIRSA